MYTTSIYVWHFHFDIIFGSSVLHLHFFFFYPQMLFLFLSNISCFPVFLYRWHKVENFMFASRFVHISTIGKSLTLHGVIHINASKLFRYVWLALLTSKKFCFSFWQFIFFSRFYGFIVISLMSIDIGCVIRTLYIAHPTRMYSFAKPRVIWHGDIINKFNEQMKCVEHRMFGIERIFQFDKCNLPIYICMAYRRTGIQAYTTHYTQSGA